MFNIDGIIKALQTDPNAQRTAMTGAAGRRKDDKFAQGRWLPFSPPWVG